LDECDLAARFLGGREAGVRLEQLSAGDPTLTISRQCHGESIRLAGDICKA
jgi:hypothetical protein